MDTFAWLLGRPFCYIDGKARLAYRSRFKFARWHRVFSIVPDISDFFGEHFQCPTPRLPLFTQRCRSPKVLLLRHRSDVIHRVLKKRLDTILPAAMRENGFDMWLVICQEDDWDPIHDTFCPMAPWRPILQVLVFFDRGPQRGVERINLSMTNMQGLYDTPWQGKNHSEQWAMLRQIVEQRDPKRIGINIGPIQWAAGGLTHNLYRQLLETLPPRYAERLDSAEPMVVHWASTLSDDEIELYEHVADVAKSLIAEMYSREAIVPGRDDLGRPGLALLAAVEQPGAAGVVPAVLLSLSQRRGRGPIRSR